MFIAEESLLEFRKGRKIHNGTDTTPLDYLKEIGLGKNRTITYI
jgi:hypothetical protein